MNVTGIKVCYGTDSEDDMSANDYHWMGAYMDFRMHHERIAKLHHDARERQWFVTTTEGGDIPLPSLDDIERIRDELENKIDEAHADVLITMKENQSGATP